MTDDEALAFGQQNEHAIAMLRNHCVNARVSISLSPYAKAVGLPIGPTEIACDHAAFFGMSGVDIMVLAVEFYEQRCVGCQYRNPTGRLPTIVTEAERRKSEREAYHTIERERQLAVENARKLRGEARDLALAGQSYTVRDLASHIDRVDRDAALTSDQDVADSRRRIIEVARLSPEHFAAVLIEDLKRLAIAKDSTALEALHELARHGCVPPNEVANIAADILSSGAHIEAGKVVADLTGSVSKDKLASASLGAIALASDWHAAFPSPRHPASPAALIALASYAWEDLRAIVLQELSHENAWRREAACHAAYYLLHEGPSRSEELLGPVLESIWGEDRGYAGDPAPAAAAARVIAEAWRQLPESSFELVERHGVSCSSEVRGVLMTVPHGLERNGGAPDRAIEYVIRFLMRRLEGDWGIEVAADASHELADLAVKRPPLLAASIAELVGGLIRACQPPSRLLVQTVKDPQLEQIEAMARQQHQHFIRRNLAEALGRIARPRPGAVFEACSAVLGATTGDELHDRETRVTFLKVFETAASPQTVALILPRLYTALLSDDAAIRAAAIGLWRACARACGTLPHDLEELAERLLTDTFVVVHEAMLDALPSLRLGEEQIRKLLDVVLRWAATYAKAENPEGLQRALDTALWGMDHFTPEWQPSIANFAIEQSNQFSASRRENLLLRSALRPYRQTAAWAKAALEILGSPDRQEIIVSPRDDQLLSALVEEPNGLENIPLELFQAVLHRHGLRSLRQCIELLELLQAVGRWLEAEQLIHELLQAIPKTEEYRSRREWIQFVSEAATNERLVAEGLVAGQTSNLGKGYSALRIHVQNRSSVRLALQQLPLNDPPAVSKSLRVAAQALRDSPTGRSQIDLFADVVTIAAHLVDYDTAVRLGHDGTQSIASARRLAELLDTHRGVTQSEHRFREFARQIGNRDNFGLDRTLALVRAMPLPLPLCPFARSPWSSQHTHASKDIEPSSPVVVCGLRLNGEPVSTISVIYQDTVPDLDVVLRLAEWPAEAKECRIEFLSTFPATALSWPSFTFGPHDVTKDARGLIISRSGHLDLLAKRPPGAVPIELDVHVQFVNDDGHATVATVAGHERLFVRPYDPTRDVMTNRRQMDQRLVEMFAELSLDSSIDQQDTEAFSVFFTACVRAAHEIMFDKLTKAGSNVSEKRFHDRFEQLLLADPSLEGRVTRRDRVAGGLDDLMFDDIVAELKVERKHPRVPQECHSYFGQPTQYGVGRGSRLSILIVLDQANKELPPAVLDNGVAWMFPRVHGYDHPRYPSRVGVLVIPGNWKVPSTWSRHSTRSAEPAR